MANQPSWRRVLLLSACGCLAVAGMAINAQAASTLGPSATSIVDGRTGIQITSMEKQVLLIIFPWFVEPPYSETRSLLENKGIKVIVASSSVDPISGYAKELTVKPDTLLSRVRTAEYEAIVFIGSGGAGYQADNADVIRIAKEGAAEGKVLAAISDGIFTLAKADLLKGKKIAAHMPDSWLQKAQATLSTAPVEQDGRIITASMIEPKKFAETIAAVLTAGTK
jgi:putative intracellular protease/amidase